MNRRTVIALSTFALFSGMAGLAPSSYAGKPETFTGLVPGVAAGGYDVVAYFSGAAKAGDPAITASHGGATYRFATAANRDAFTANPVKYAPRYGGYCAWAVSQGYTAKGDPEAWSVVDGRLYLNYSKSVRAQWSKDAQGNIAKGNANWPKVLE